MITLRIAAAAALLSTAGAALAQTATDAQCFLLSNAYAKQAKADTNEQKMAEASVYFYLGRMAPNATAAQMKTLLDTQSKAIKQEDAPKLMQACADALRGRMEVLRSLAAPEAKTQKPQGR